MCILNSMRSYWARRRFGVGVLTGESVKRIWETEMGDCNEGQEGFFNGPRTGQTLLTDEGGWCRR